jgi:hypothetical protein
LRFNDILAQSKSTLGDTEEVHECRLYYGRLALSQTKQFSNKNPHSLKQQPTKHLDFPPAHPLGIHGSTIRVID